MPEIEYVNEATDIPSVQFTQQASDVAAPEAGFWQLFFKSTGIWIRQNAAAALRLLTTNDLLGDVGIGTASPGARLDVWGDTTGVLTRVVNSTVANISNTITSQFLLKTDAAQRAALQIITSMPIIADGTRTSVTSIASPIQGIFATRIILNSVGNIELTGNMLGLNTAKTPASASAAGVAGSICWDTNYVYVCVATNTWKRVAIATW